MSAHDSLKAAMRDALDADGTISHIKAELRAAVFRRLADTTAHAAAANNNDSSVDDDEQAAMTGAAVAHPPTRPENLLLNELIKDYLAYNGLEHTLAVFELEARVPATQVPRRVLASELNLLGAPTSLPLLYAMLHEAHLSRDLTPQ